MHLPSRLHLSSDQLEIVAASLLAVLNFTVVERFCLLVCCSFLREKGLLLFIPLLDTLTAVIQEFFRAFPAFLDAFTLVNVLFSVGHSFLLCGFSHLF